VAAAGFALLYPLFFLSLAHHLHAFIIIILFSNTHTNCSRTQCASPRIGSVPPLPPFCCTPNVFLLSCLSLLSSIKLLQVTTPTTQNLHSGAQAPEAQPIDGGATTQLLLNGSIDSSNLPQLDGSHSSQPPLNCVRVGAWLTRENEGVSACARANKWIDRLMVRAGESLRERA